MRCNALVLLCSVLLQQLSVTEVKVDKVQVSGAGNTTFAVCLDQDEKKILQSVTRYGAKMNTHRQTRLSFYTCEDAVQPSLTLTLSQTKF